MKRYIKYISILLICSLSSESCEKYLDKTIETDLAKEDVFKDFAHAQGYVEVMYGYVVNYAQSAAQNNGNCFLLGDEVLSMNTSMPCGAWDFGNLAAYSMGYFYNTGGPSSGLTGVGIWNGFEAIRRANQVIENEPLMVGCTETEKNLLLGQAYFFRAYFHMEIMKFWGRIPYIDKVLTGNGGDYKLVRPATYRECAERVDEDFATAAELLPYNWDDLQNDPDAKFLTFKPETFGNNLMRINKVIVYSFKGKNLLLAASPLMNDESDTYKYDQELCKRAAEDFARVIQRDRDDNVSLGLASRENYPKVFHNDQSDKTEWPGTAKYVGANQGEYIFSSQASGTTPSRKLATSLMPLTDAAPGNRMTPSHRFIHNHFGTAHGLACDDDITYDLQKEFDDRDPRFYENHIIDGDMIIQAPKANVAYKYAQMCCGDNANMLYKITPLPTGYFVKKWAPITYNYKTVVEGAADNKIQIAPFWLSMRLTDVYLMYAEALAATDEFGAAGKPSYSFMPGGAPSSIEVLDMLRDRFGVPHVAEAYSGPYCKNPIDVTDPSNRNRYMDILRKERAVEMCYEGHRWTDLRRWRLAEKEEYRIKTGLKYERNKYNKLGDRTTFKNINFREDPIWRTRVCDYPKHYWLPFPNDMTLLYDGFEQNPGW